MARETGAGEVIVTSSPEDVARADRIVLPGDGAFPACRRALVDRTGLYEAMVEAVERKGRPFLGICVGMQLLADVGREHGDHRGLGWIGGEVARIAPADPALKIPHMGWNELVLARPHHPLLAGIGEGAHAYFVHSYAFVCAEDADVLARVDYGGPITAIIGRDNIAGTQFHPEKSQAVGLRLIANFLGWRP
jgi:glutamine amidotransferase